MYLNIVLQIMFSIRPLRQAILADYYPHASGLFLKMQEVFYGLMRSEKPVGEHLIDGIFYDEVICANLTNTRQAFSVS